MKRLLFALTLVVALPVLAAAAGLDFTVAPATIDIHALYNGTTLQIDGQVPAGSQVVLRFIGAPESVALKQKGKVFGLLWMNMNTLHFDNVPKVCLIESSTPLTDMGTAGTELGLESLAKGFGIEPATADRAMLLPEFLLLKSQEGLYRQEAGAVAMGEIRDGNQSFRATMRIPSRLSPGSYAIEAYAVKDGAIKARDVQAVEAALSGAPAFLANLAFNHGAWYGILASIIAILGGLGIGLVFQSKGAH
ncbi:TIGR02186 family protein [Desulfovibrio sp. TomC]|uniref:TIGR02186 family protein n=1 Tax=Desulfovibrio sp. TomC TaxID=1562888 RepID=UPI0005739AD0|nr:TIGR02186 family protein [Desulfovibrio sp. TomC]KHK02450.1 Transmembrane protein co-occuring with sulfite exporter TauE/SafE [Desulfovibrio sp. TomC]